MIPFSSVGSLFWSSSLYFVGLPLKETSGPSWSDLVDVSITPQSINPVLVVLTSLSLDRGFLVSIYPLSTIQLTSLAFLRSVELLSNKRLHTHH